MAHIDKGRDAKHFYKTTFDAVRSAHLNRKIAYLADGYVELTMTTMVNGSFMRVLNRRLVVPGAHGSTSVKVVERLEHLAGDPRTEAVLQRVANRLDDWTVCEIAHVKAVGEMIDAVNVCWSGEFRDLFSRVIRLHGTAAFKRFIPLEWWATGRGGLKKMQKLVHDFNSEDGRTLLLLQEVNYG